MKLLTRPEEFVMLAIWRLQDEAYSLPIRKQVSESTGYEWSLSSVYTPLNRLTKKRLPTSYHPAPLLAPGGRPPRVYQPSPPVRRSPLRSRSL